MKSEYQITVVLTFEAESDRAAVEMFASSVADNIFLPEIKVVNLDTGEESTVDINQE